MSSCSDVQSVTVEDFYWNHRNRVPPVSITAHLSTLRLLADGLDSCIEFGAGVGASASALLMGASRVVSWDIVETPEATKLKAAAGDRWDYRIQSSIKAPAIETELLLIDSLHTYEQCASELELHADAVSRYLVFHDTLTFGSVGALGETGEQSWSYKRGESVPHGHLGIRPAIDELMVRDPSWFIFAHDTGSHGLLILERRGANG